MKIEWNITKERGNIRPLLSYSLTVEKFEKALALPPVLISSTIPEPNESWREYCYPNCDERLEIPAYKGFYRLELVSHKGGNYTQKLRLPWRKDNQYPEVEESFKLLREAFEEELKNANASQPMNENFYLQVSDAANQEIAPSVLAEKFLNFAMRENRFA